MNIEEFSFDLDEKSVKNLKKAIGYDEIEARHKRFMNGTETIDDLINGVLHYQIKNADGLDLDVVDFKYYKKIIDLYEKEKEANRKLDKEAQGLFELYNFNDSSLLAKILKDYKKIIEKQSKEIEEYKKQLDLDYVDKHYVPIERYNQLEKEIEELKDFNTKLQATKNRLDSYDKENTLEIEKLKKEIEELKNGQIDFWISDKEIEERIRNKFVSKDKIKWRPIKEYDRQKYDWVLVKYFDRDYECVPEVAEKRSDGKWYTSEREIPFEVKYFFDMQSLLEKE